MNIGLRGAQAIALAGLAATAAAQHAVLPDALPFESPRSIEQWRDAVVGPLEPSSEGLPPSRMLAQYLVDRIDLATTAWDERFDALASHEDIAAYQAQLRSTFVDGLGQLPERTDLNAKVTGTLQRPGYRVEKILFESLPSFYVTAALFLPDSDAYAPPYPGVLVPSGHYVQAKAWDEYQAMGALLALSGMAALVFDPIEQGERRQVLGSGMHNVDGHNALGPGSIVLGRNTTWFYLWDAIRALDYLASRPEVDPERLGCTGNSGGGTQTLFLTALDERIVAAAPSCSLSRMTSKARRGPGDVEQHIFNQIARGLDEPDYLMMRAPDVAWFVCTATQDFVDIHSAWLAVRHIKRLYTKLGYPERVNLLEEDALHSYGKTQREAVARWMALWLRNEHRVIEEPDLELFTVDELRVAPEGDVMRIPDARNAYDINAEYADSLKQARKARWQASTDDAIRARVRELTGICRLSELPQATVLDKGKTPEGASALIIQPEAGIYLPAVVWQSSGAAAGVTLVIDDAGKTSDFAAATIKRLRDQNHIVVAADLRGDGETATASEQQDGYNYFRAHDLGRSLLAMRAEDVLGLARFVSENYAAGGPVAVHAAGSAGTAALHAAALEPNLFTSVRVERALASYDQLARTPVPEAQWNTIVHGALDVYDLPDLARVLGDKALIDTPLGANGRPLTDPAPHYDAVLCHRWRFDQLHDNRSPDDVGSADAILHGAAVVRDGAADLTSNPLSGDAAEPGAAWIELPIAETLRAATQGLTVEVWFTESEPRGQAKLWSFGSSHDDEFYLWPEYGNGYSHVVTGLRTRPDAPWRNAYTIVPLAANEPHHIVVTLYRDAWTHELRLYIDGECANVLKSAGMPSDIAAFTHCFLGRHCSPSNTGFPLWNGTIHEFRIYNGAMTFNEVERSYRAGLAGEPGAGSQPGQTSDDERASHTTTDQEEV